MSFQTVSGIASADAAASGLKEYASGAALAAADLNADFQDLQVAPYYMLLAGVLEGGVCTASGLNVTIPADTIYYARQVWKTDGNGQVVSVPDSATTYLWGCADGQVRQTTDTTPPSGWDNRSACILTKAVAAGGVATLDNSVQHRTRYANGISRMAADNGGLWAGVPDTIPAGARAEVPANHQVEIFDTLAVEGVLAVYGRVRVSP